MRKSTLRIAIVAIVLAGSMFLLISAASAPKNSSCKETMDDCSKRKNMGEPDQKSWEHLSRQFFSSI
ncbi:MAG: hypothetical protein ACHQFX_06905 [Chitinophagales bacterium]